MNNYFLRCRYFSENENNKAPRTAAEARALIGSRVKYLRNCDIDKSGRGYIFPKYGTIIGAYRRNIEMENNDFISINDIVELVVLP